MTNFLVLASLLSVVVVVLLVWAGIRQQGASRARHAREHCYRVHEGTLAELHDDHTSGRISIAAYEQARIEAERRLIDDLRHIDAQPLVQRRYRWIVPVVFSIPLLAAGLYLMVGNLAGSDPEANFIRTGNVGQFISAVTQLEEKVRQNPEDLSSQLMLARSYRAMGRYEDSVIAYGKAWPLVQKNPTELAIFAGVLAVYRGEFAGKPDELLEQALALDPDNHDALTLAGGSAFQKANYAEALRHWQKLAAMLPEGSEEEGWLQTQISDAQRLRDDPTAVPEAPSSRSLQDIHAFLPED